MQTDYYQLLGVSRHVTHEGLQRAFRARVLDVHPDLNHADRNAAELTRQIIEAYRVLCDPLDRRQYDMSFLETSPPIAAPNESIVPTFVMTLVCILKKLFAFALLIIGAIALIWAIVCDRPPVFRAELIDQRISAPHQTFQDVIEPQMPDYLEWYAAREYRLSPTNGWAASEIVNSYIKAALKAASLGDKQSAAFYRQSIKQIRNNGF